MSSSEQSKWAIKPGAIKPRAIKPRYSIHAVKPRRKPSVRKVLLAVALCAFVFGVAATPQINAQVTLLAVGSLTRSQAGSYADLSGLHNTLESGVSANLLGGLGSGFAYASGNTFLGLPDRGPNADQYDDNIDSTVSY